MGWPVISVSTDLMHLRYISTYLHAVGNYGICCTVRARYRSTRISNNLHIHLLAVFSPSVCDCCQIYSSELFLPILPFSPSPLFPASSTRGAVGPFPTFDTKGKKRAHSLTRSGQGTEEMGIQKRTKKGMSQASSIINCLSPSQVGSLPAGLSALLVRMLHIAV